MASIGSFGATAPPPEVGDEPDTFEFHGTEFVVPDGVPWVYVGEFSEAAEAEGAEAFSAGMRMIRGVIGADQWPRFRELAAAHCSSFEDLMAPCMAIIETISARPTQRPSDSAAGPLTTADSLKALSSSEESSNLSPIQRDPRIRALKPVADAAADLVSAL